MYPFFLMPALPKGQQGTEMSCNFPGKILGFPPQTSSTHAPAVRFNYGIALLGQLPDTGISVDGGENSVRRAEAEF